MAQFVSIEVAAAVATIRIDRPPVNALNRALQEELRAAAHELTHNSDVRAVVMWGGPKVFAAGADVKEMADWSFTDATDNVEELQSSLTAIARMPKPVIAAVTGYALGGGCELTLCADLRIVGEGAQFGQPEILLGVIPGAGGTQRLARLIGPAKAKDLIFTGRFVKAEEALRIGLADRIVPDDQVYDEALKLAKRLAAGPPYALRAAKEAIDRGLDTDIDTGLAIERQGFVGLFATEDRRTGMDSFIADGPGKATFSGR
jgi:enoyl-CoA hydratase/carnithine racemase